MKLYVKNQLGAKIESTCGIYEYALEPGEEVTVEAQDEDYMYLDIVR